MLLKVQRLCRCLDVFIIVIFSWRTFVECSHLPDLAVSWTVVHTLWCKYLCDSRNPRWCHSERTCQWLCDGLAEVMWPNWHRCLITITEVTGGWPVLLYVFDVFLLYISYFLYYYVVLHLTLLIYPSAILWLQYSINKLSQKLSQIIFSLVTWLCMEYTACGSFFYNFEVVLVVANGSSVSWLKCPLCLLLFIRCTIINGWCTY